MKKLTALLLISLALVMALTSCKGKEEKKETVPAQTQSSENITQGPVSGSCEITMISPEGTVLSTPCDIVSLGDNPTLLSAITSDRLKDFFKADVTDGEYVMINSIGDLVPDVSKNEYISIFTTDENYKFGDAEVINEISVYPSSVGAGDLVLKDGAVYIFAIRSF